MSSFPEHPGYTERREVAKKSLCRCCLMPSRRLCVCGASFMAAAAPKPLLPGCNRLACCFNKRGWFGGHEEERQRGEERERERERESHSSKLIQTPEVGEREREREREVGCPCPHSEQEYGTCSWEQWNLPLIPLINLYTVWQLAPGLIFTSSL